MLKLDKTLTPAWYTPEVGKEDDEDATAPEFLLAPLTEPQILEVWDYWNAETGRITSKGLHKAAQYAVREWNNVVDGHEKPLKCNSFNLNKLPFYLLADLGGEIVKRSILTDEQLKN